MKLKKYKKTIRLSIIAIFISLFVYFSLFGRLVPFSPLIIGFEKKEFDKAIIYFEKTDSIKEFSSIDEIIKSVEEIHDLKFKRKVKFFLTKSNSQHKRFTGTNARFVTMPIEGRIFISDKAKKDYRNDSIQFETYIRHELSHAILYQNISFFKSLKYPLWFMEGLAMYTANQVGTDGYYTYQQVVDTLRKGYFAEPSDWGTLITSKGVTVKNCQLENKFWFIYSEYAMIINDLAEEYGRSRVINFMKESLTINEFYDLFNRTFNISFEDRLNQYKLLQTKGDYSN